MSAFQLNEECFRAKYHFLWGRITAEQLAEIVRRNYGQGTARLLVECLAKQHRCLSFVVRKRGTASVKCKGIGEPRNLDDLHRRKVAATRAVPQWTTSTRPAESRSFTIATVDPLKILNGAKPGQWDESEGE